MRASLKLLYALAIFARVPLLTACGTPPTETADGGDTLCADGQADDPNCVQPDAGPPDGGNPTDAGTQLDGGPRPPNPCAGLVVPRANRCWQFIGDPPIEPTHAWNLKVGAQNECLLQGTPIINSYTDPNHFPRALTFLMTRDMSGTISFDEITTDGFRYRCGL